jgi:acyl-CoA thioester hydrolase
VRYEETDAMGVVYHANDLRYFEVGRVELLRALGVSYRGLEERGHRLAVVEARAAFRAPARFDDLIAVRCFVGRLRSTRIDLRYELRRDGRLLCEGETVLACLDREGRPSRLPDEVRAAFEDPGAPGEGPGAPGETPGAAR